MAIQTNNSQAVKGKIIDTLRATGREGIENVIDYMCSHGFFTHGCHGHHRYKGGLADHAWQTYQAALMMAKGDDKVDGASLAICALLHDFCKCDGMWHHHGHGKRSARMVQELGVHLSGPEFLGIRFHMSLRGHKDHRLHDAALACRCRHYVHKADTISAMQYKGSEIGLGTRSMMGGARP